MHLFGHISGHYLLGPIHVSQLYDSIIIDDLGILIASKMACFDHLTSSSLIGFSRPTSELN